MPPYHYLNYGRNTILKWCEAFFQRQKKDNYNVLDIGCGYGHDLLNVRDKTSQNVNLYGIEIYKPAIQTCENSNIWIFSIDIEKESIPIEEGFFDIIIINQVLEHTKEIFFIFSEISRTLKIGGILIVGVPNLASLHNRQLLLFGRQPTCIETLGPHVRGFTIPSLKKFIEAVGCFKILEVRGANFYPFPPAISGHLSKLFPGGSASILFLAERTEKKGNFIGILRERKYETYYFGNSN